MLAAEQFDTNSIFSKLSGVRRVALAVSGGSDSVAMMLLAHKWAKAQKIAPDLFVLTVDHGLRSEAMAEAQQVAHWCARLGIPHQILPWQHGEIKTGIQAKARKARYDLMVGWCTENDVGDLLTAHTADDQAETVAMRLHRTDSLASIAGIWPVVHWKAVRVMRPLLALRREDLRSYLQNAGQKWIEDPSNFDVRFERVRVRNRLAGTLKGLDALAAEAQSLITSSHGAMQSWCEKNFETHETGFPSVSRAALNDLSASDLDFVVSHMIRRCGAEFNTVEREERLRLVQWLGGSATGRRSLGGALFAKRQAVLIVGREPGRIEKIPAIFGSGGTLIWDGRFELHGPIGSEVVPLCCVKGVPRRRDIPAFVQDGLPAMLQNGEIWSIPHLKIGHDVFVRYLRH